MAGIKMLISNVKIYINVEDVNTLSDIGSKILPKVDT
jgi:hypothetical protein